MQWRPTRDRSGSGREVVEILQRAIHGESSRRNDAVSLADECIGSPRAVGAASLSISLEYAWGPARLGLIDRLIARNVW